VVPEEGREGEVFAKQRAATKKLEETETTRGGK
jgi:hypothetical protein